MDEFHISSSESDVLVNSHLVAELHTEVSEMELFPVLLGTHVAEFHNVDGGYHKSKGFHVLNLIHEVQGHGSPFHGDVYQSEVEIHADGYWNLDVEGIREYGDYPDEDYVLSLEVTDYRSGPYSFAEELQMDIDKRETEYSYE